MSKVKITFVALCFVLGVSVAIAQSTRKHAYRPPQGYVPDATTAKAIVVAVWSPIYGAKHIQSEKPFRVSLKNGVWTVKGSLRRGWKGGVAEAEISKRDGRILRISHGK